MKVRRPWWWLAPAVAFAGAVAFALWLIAEPDPPLSRLVSVAGLVLDIVGVVILARGAFIGPEVTTGIGTFSSNPDRLAEALAKNRAEAPIGLILIGLGFFAQLLATAFG